MLAQLHESYPWLLPIAGGVSALLFVGTLIIVPVVVLRIPADYFSGVKRRSSPRRGKRRVPEVITAAGTNAAGVLLVFAGLIMLVTPGQGLLTIAAGLLLANFPGKYRLERWIITRRRVWKSVNWLRRKAHVPELRLPGKSAGAFSGERHE
ncbi:MAG: PGPGW domain-containing protein [Kiritimatiellia bacterium]